MKTVKQCGVLLPVALSSLFGRNLSRRRRRRRRESSLLLLLEAKAQHVTNKRRFTSLHMVNSPSAGTECNLQPT